MGLCQHDLKILPCYFKQVIDKNKTFEIRDNRDRGFQKGDKVLLREYDDSLSPFEQFKYTYRKVEVLITFVTAYEQKEGNVVFSFQILNEDL